MSCGRIAVHICFEWIWDRLFTDTEEERTQIILEGTLTSV